MAVEYRGTGFFGFQRQHQSPTIQACLEQALSSVADAPVVVHCAGRTDTGVHALGQVVHFDSDAERPARGWVLGCNSQLPEGISVHWARIASEDFHARFDASMRMYRYRILNRWTRPGLLAGRVAWIRRPLDAGAMHEAAQALLGEHDFSSFRAPGCQARHPVRTIHAIDVRRDGEEVRIEVRANAFLYHMVRSIAGTLIAVGDGSRPAGWVCEVLAARQRALAGVTAPAEGLYFIGVHYPEHPELSTLDATGRPQPGPAWDPVGPDLQSA
ncbi:MAG: tRNA pseudouridine(38-40) synthase TruA [Wenzhouxiangellaceae bacterium]